MSFWRLVGGWTTESYGTMRENGGANGGVRMEEDDATSGGRGCFRWRWWFHLFLTTSNFSHFFVLLFLWLYCVLWVGFVIFLMLIMWCFEGKESSCMVFDEMDEWVLKTLIFVAMNIERCYHECCVEICSWWYKSVSLMLIYSWLFVIINNVVWVKIVMGGEWMKVVKKGWRMMLLFVKKYWWLVMIVVKIGCWLNTWDMAFFS